MVCPWGSSPLKYVVYDILSSERCDQQANQCVNLTDPVCHGLGFRRPATPTPSAIYSIKAQQSIQRARAAPARPTGYAHVGPINEKYDSMTEYEYKFVRVGESKLLGVKPEATEEYQAVVLKHAKEGWRLVQVFAPMVGRVGSGMYHEIILEREIQAETV